MRCAPPYVRPALAVLVASGLGASSLLGQAQPAPGEQPDLTAAGMQDAGIPSASDTYPEDPVLSDAGMKAVPQATGDSLQDTGAASAPGDSLAVATTADAGQPEAERPPEAESVPPGETPAPREALPPGTEARAVPDYDGRAAPATTAGEVLLWVPRVTLFPLYVISEYVIRKPFGLLVTEAEREHWLAVLGDFFTFGVEQKVGIVPTAYLEFGFEPSVGLYFFADDAFGDRNDLRIKAGVWPDDWWSVLALDRWTNQSETVVIDVRGGFVDRPDFRYHGIGPLTRDHDGSRYSDQTATAALGAEFRPWRASFMRLQAGARAKTFDAETDFADDDDPSLATALADPDHAITKLPPGFSSGYTAVYLQATAALDSRRPFPAPSHGVRLEVGGVYARDVQNPADAWVRASAAAGGFVDVGSHRVLMLSTWAELVEPLKGEVPFTELSAVGGLEPMAGFQAGRLWGHSRAGATFEYRWPVWVWIDMALHYSVGNVFGAGFAGLAADNLRSSFGIGLRSARTSEPDHAVQFLLAVGTNTFGQGTEVDTVRLLFGGSRGF